MNRPLHEIARDIRTNWKKPYFGAVPYIDAMAELNSINDAYYHDDAKSIVRYFLANASTFRGDVAKSIKTELKGLI